MSASGCRRWAVRAVVVVALLVLTVQAVVSLLELPGRWAVPSGRRLGDLQVYWAATGALLDGGDLYGARSPNTLQFTYPPVAAMLLAPLRLLPLEVVQGGWLAGTVLVAVALPVLVASRYPVARGRAVPAGAAAFGVLTLLASDSLRACLHYGQVGVVLVAVVAVDALCLRPRWQGLGVGAVAAVRLTPALIGVVALLRGRARPAWTAGGVAVGATLVAAAVLPRESWAYWTGHLWDTGRVGVLDDSANLSLLGILLRAGLDAPVAWAVWGLLLAGTLVAASRLARPALAGLPGPGRDAALLRVYVAGGLLSQVFSPVSWRHHWVWLPLAAVLLHLGGRYLAALAVAVVAALPLPSASVQPLFLHVDVLSTTGRWLLVPTAATSAVVAWWLLRHEPTGAAASAPGGRPDDRRPSSGARPALRLGRLGAGARVPGTPTTGGPDGRQG